MNYLLIILTILLFVLQTLSLKLIKAKGLAEKLLSNCFFALLAAVMMGVLCIFLPSLGMISPPTLVCGGLFGLCFALTILFYLSAISCGPLSYTSFYLSASMLLPAGAGILLFQEKLTPSLVIAMLFFLAAFYCLNVSGEDKKASRNWLLFCLLTFLCNGSCGIIQKTQQYLTGGQEAAGMMLIGFSCAAICYGTAYLAVRLAGTHGAGASASGAGASVSGSPDTAASLPASGRKPSASVLKRNLLPVFLLAASSLGGNLLLTYLSGQNDGSYLFPLVQGSIILGVTLCSVLFFQERLTSRGKLGILAGTIGIIIINL